MEWHEYDANCRWIDIEETLNDCYGADSDDTDRCVILCKQGQNTYVQTSYDNDNGIERWRLEWRVTQPDGSYRHYYGVDKTPESRYHELVCDLRTVMETFHYFYVTGGTVLPTEKLEWYEMDLTRSDE